MMVCGAEGRAFEEPSSGEKMGWPYRKSAQASPVPQICVVAIRVVRVFYLARKITEVGGPK